MSTEPKPDVAAPAAVTIWRNPKDGTPLYSIRVDSTAIEQSVDDAVRHALAGFKQLGDELLDNGAKKK